MTDDLGEARTNLTTSRETNVRANVAGKEGTARVTLVNLPSATIAVTPATPSTGTPITVTVTPGAAAGGNPIRDVLVDFGDGETVSLGAITGATPVQHIYTRAQTYTITVTTIDTSAQRTSSSTVVNVAPANVGMIVTASPNPADSGSAVTITVTPSNPNNLALTGIRVDFGDGTSGTLPPAGGALQKVYNLTSLAATTFTIRATATDQAGGQYANTAQLVVRPRAALTVTLDASVSENTNTFSCSDTYPKTCTTSLSAFVPPPGLPAGVRVVFTANPGAFTTVSSFQWDFNGDGITDRQTTGNSTDFTFTAPGEYRVRVRVVGIDGSIGEQTLTMRIAL